MGDQAPQAQGYPSPGDVIAGRYLLVNEIGCGAMGSVWAGRHVALGSSVAIKFLHPETVASDEARERFAREARIAANLGERCRYVVRVLDYGVLDEVGPYLVMEYLRGEELASRLRRHGRIPLLDAAHIVAQLCRALSVAHHKGVVHRDVKPSNVFLAQPHTNMAVFVKLMDFGVAKLLDRGSVDDPGLKTRIGAVIGTPAYMSPEQLLAQNVDHRADLWGVATTTYRILTGELPFGNGTLAEMGVRIVTGTPRPPSELVPTLPKAVDAWMAKALSKSPDDRFQSAREMSEAFAAAAGVELGLGLRIVHPTPVPSSDPLESGVRPASVEALTVRDSPTNRPKRAAPARLAFAALFLLGALIVMLGRRRDEKTAVDAALSALPSPSVAVSVPEPTVTASAAPAPSPSPSPRVVPLKNKAPKPTKN